MAFINQISSKIQDIKNNQLPQVIEHANKARQNIMPTINKCSQQVQQTAAAVGHLGAEKLDALGKILQVNVSPKSSPIDLLPAITAFDPALENTEFKFLYNESSHLIVQNIGSCVIVKYADDGSENLSLSFLSGEQYHLEYITFHWGTEPMNGSEHTVGGVGYGGEIHFVHRNLKYPSMEAALKQQNGVVAIGMFLNETHDDNMTLMPLTNVLGNIIYNGTETVITSLSASQLISIEKNKEFWIYEGSETIEPFREAIKWIICRSAVPISSGQLDKFRQIRKSRAEDEVEEAMTPIRSTQPANSRLIHSSFKSVAQAQLPN